MGKLCQLRIFELTSNLANGFIQTATNFFLTNEGYSTWFNIRLACIFQTVTTQAL